MRVSTNKRQSSRTQALKQFVLILCCVLSLLASSVSACICSHHQQQTETEAPSCHSHTAENVAAEQTNDADSPAKTIIASASDADACCCVQPAPKVAAQSETVKPEKQAAALTTTAAAPRADVFIVRIIPVENRLPKPLYLTDSFYNLSPGRAPPRL
jgi:cytoskeletal protein RodZ